MKKYPIFFLLLLLNMVSGAQQKVVDSLKPLLPTLNDTVDLVYSRLLSEAYEEINFDSATVYARKYLKLSQKLDYKLEQAEALREMAYYVAGTASGLEFTEQAQKLIQQDQGKKILPGKYLDMLHIPASLQPYPKYSKHVNGSVVFVEGIQYFFNNDLNKARPLFSQALETGRSLPDSELLMLSYTAFGIFEDNTDSAIGYLENAYRIAQKLNHEEVGNIEGILASRYGEQHNHSKELLYLKSCLLHDIQFGRFKYSGGDYQNLANYYKSNGAQRDSVFLYAKKAFQVAVNTNNFGLQYEVSKLFFETYKNEKNTDSAFKYLDIMLAAKEKISNEETVRKFEAASFNMQMQRSAIEASNEELRNKVRVYSLLAGLALFFFLAIVFWRNSKRRKKEFLLLQKQKAKTDETLQELKSTQSQLIQSEKMASLGELTAGIAHEIQNPLNFVNNFSDLNTELVDELQEELKTGNVEEAGYIADDIKTNNQKISHHGKRAESIVTGMLQHTRTSSGQKEPTDINKLADEYLRLAYHGIRAKDKNFNCDIVTEFDGTIGKINIIPQDIGRVLLNLYNNAFYAVNERLRHAQPDNRSSELVEEYKPTVTVTTKKENSRILISIADNGNGISDKIKDKIFNPFFTTKPTGQGTGLGLSLSYDIVKAHGGELKVETKEGEGTTFIIQLPIGT